jgi:predicted enzyme related to lactoylglutathione lyase
MGDDSVTLKKIHAVYLFVSDIRKSSAWYSKVLGIPLSIDEENFGLINIGGSELCFHQADEKSPVSLGGSVGYWQVDDLLHTAQLFEKHDGKIYRGPISIPNLDQGICQIKDPFGNVIGLQGKYKVN